MDTTQFKKVEMKKYPQLAGRRTAESRYWRNFKFPVVVKEFAAVTSIDFSKASPHDFAVTSSTRVQIYSPHTNTVKKTISRFKDIAYSGTFRDDGKLLLAGGENGIVQLFDVNSKAILRTFKGHDGPVHVTRFGLNKTNILSCSDDTTVRCWDIPSEALTLKFTEHEDYVRAGLVSPDNNDIWLTGSYDHKIKIWDLRMGKSVVTINHGAPVESLLMFPGGGVVVSAGSNELKVWDILGGGRLMRTLSNHQKTITDLCFDSSYSRILTASLDHHVKIYNVEDYKVVHSVKYPAPLLCVGISPDDTHLVAGMATGLLSIRRRVVKDEEQQSVPSTRVPRGGTYAYYIRGRKRLPLQSDFAVQQIRKPHLRPYDAFVKKFQYSNALDAVLKKKSTALEIVSLIEELVHRDGLRIALKGRDENTLFPILNFLDKNMLNPRYSVILLNVFEMVLDMYGSVVGQSPKVDKALLRLHLKIRHELTLQKQMYSLLGSLDLLFASSNF